MITSLQNCLIILAIFGVDVLAGTLLPYMAGSLASTLYFPSPVNNGVIDVRDDVAQLLLSIVFLLQLQFVYAYCINSSVIVTLQSFQVQSILLECLYIINFIRGCALLTFIAAAARSGHILKPLYSFLQGGPPVPEPPEGFLSMFVWTGSDGEKTQDDGSILLLSIAKTPLGYFIVSYLYVILQYFSLQYLEENIIFDQFEIRLQEDVRNNNIRLL